jgi:hypothetical protein
MGSQTSIYVHTKTVYTPVTLEVTLNGVTRRLMIQNPEAQRVLGFKETPNGLPFWGDAATFPNEASRWERTRYCEKGMVFSSGLLIWFAVCCAQGFLIETSLRWQDLFEEQEIWATVRTLMKACRSEIAEAVAFGCSDDCEVTSELSDRLLQERMSVAELIGEMRGRGLDVISVDDAPMGPEVKDVWLCGAVILVCGAEHLTHGSTK